MPKARFLSIFSILCGQSYWHNSVFMYCSSKFGRLILTKIIKIVVTRCQILRPKSTKFDFGWGSAQDPAGGAYNAPPYSLAGKEEACCPPPKNTTPRSQPLMPRPRCSHAFFFPNLVMSATVLQLLPLLVILPLLVRETFYSTSICWLTCGSIDYY